MTAPNKTASRASQKQAAGLMLLDSQLCFALYSTSLAMTKLYKPLLADLGLTYPQYLVMLILWEQDGCSVSEIGTRLMLDSGTLTPLLKRLASAGLIERSRSASDERKLRIHLTPQGRAMQAQARSVPECVMRALKLEPAELLALRQRLQDMRALIV